MTTYRDRALIRSAIVWAHTHPGSAPSDADCDEIHQATARQLLGIRSDRPLRGDSGHETPLSGTSGTPKLPQEPTDD